VADSASASHLAGRARQAAQPPSTSRRRPARSPNRGAEVAGLSTLATAAERIGQLGCDHRPPSRARGSANLATGAPPAARHGSAVTAPAATRSPAGVPARATPAPQNRPATPARTGSDSAGSGNAGSANAGSASTSGLVRLLRGRLPLDARRQRGLRQARSPAWRGVPASTSSARRRTLRPARPPGLRVDRLDRRSGSGVGRLVESAIGGWLRAICPIASSGPGGYSK
jgi:hypothetical protein